MSTLTIRIQDEKAERLKLLARSRNISVNKLFDEWATVALTEHDAQVRFEVMAAKGDPAKGIEILNELDKLDSETK